MAQLECKHSEWLTEYTFENCKLNRGEYGRFLTNYLTREHDGFVLNLNGAWGTGKTEFLRRLYSSLTIKGHPTIYIDAWESDFSEIPLSVVSSELLNQLSCINHKIGDDLEKVGEFLGKALKGIIIGGAGLLSKNFLGDASAGSEMAKSLFDQSPKDFINSVKGDHAEQVDAIKKIRTELEALSEVIKKNYDCELPVFVLIDELDRCRPSYAIEMLEVIKHFFTTKNFVFVVATDTCQLKESIKSVYGSGFDSTTYLKRFFNREARLDEPDLEHYIGLFDFNTSEYNQKVKLYPLIGGVEKDTINKYLTWIATAFELSLRDVDQLINKLNACLRSALDSFDFSGNVQLINVFSLIVALVEFDMDHPQFSDRKDNKPLTDMEFADFKIDTVGSGSNFSDLYRLNMYCSVKHNTPVLNQLKGGSDILVLGTHVNLSGLITSKYKGVLRNAYFNINDIFESSEYDDKNKVWLWEDYQRVVKLAGKIE